VSTKAPRTPRNLWPELFRCVRETRPRAIIAENVKGLLRPSFRPYYDYIMRELSAPFERRVEGAGLLTWCESRCDVPA
jgi:DNA (cytosine-5)-methyltransferase 1